MKRIVSFLLFTSLITLSHASLGECPKATVMKLRVAKMKAIEKLDAYEIEAGEKLVDGGLVLATGECQANEHALILLQLKGISRFSSKDFEGAKKAFRALFAVKQELPLMEKLANPKMVRFYKGVLAQYRAELKKKADTKAKIKKLEDATGMPPEPKENPKVPLEHTPRLKGLRGRKITIYCRLMDEIKATKVTLFLKGSDDNFGPLQMKKVGQRRFVLTLSGKQTSTPILAYYLMAFNAADKPVAASGNSAQPHTITMEIAEEKDSSESAGAKNTTKTEGTKGQEQSKEVKQVEDDDPTDSVDPSKEEPDELRKVKKVKKVAPWDEGAAPILQVTVSGGYALGLVSGDSEVVEDELATGIAPSKTLQVELGYMADRRTVYSLVMQMGWNSITDDASYAPDSDRVDSNEYYFSPGVRNDLRFLLRYKKYSIPGDIPTVTQATGMRWRWYWGLGVGYGTIRHETPAKDESGTEFDDTHFAQGLLLNGLGGVNYCFTSGCGLAATFEVSYIATLSIEDPNYLHLDFLMGFTGTF